MATIKSLHTDPWLELRRFGRFLLSELKPKGPVLTPFNLVTGGLILATIVLLTYPLPPLSKRFAIPAPAGDELPVKVLLSTYKLAP